MINSMQAVDIEKVAKLFSLLVGVKDIQCGGQYRTLFLSHPDNNKIIKV